MKEKESFDVGRKAEFIKKLHEKTKVQLEEKAKYYAHKANKGQRPQIFEEGDLVWVHLRKERFPSKRKSKLAPRGDGPFKVLKKIGDNAYKIDLPGDYGVSSTFNVSDLSPFDDVGDYDLDSRSNPFQEGENDAGRSQPLPPPIPSVDGPLTRSKARRLHMQVQDLVFYISCKHQEEQSRPTILSIFQAKATQGEPSEPPTTIGPPPMG